MPKVKEMCSPFIEGKKPRKKREPLSEEKRAIMTAKRRATIAVKTQACVQACVDLGEYEEYTKILYELDNSGILNAISPEKWLITQFGLSDNIAKDCVDKYIRNKAYINVNYNITDGLLDVNDKQILSNNLSNFYTVTSSLF
jgi:hypothetical protein